MGDECMGLVVGQIERHEREMVRATSAGKARGKRQAGLCFAASVSALKRARGEQEAVSPALSRKYLVRRGYYATAALIPPDVPHTEALERVRVL